MSQNIRTLELSQINGIKYQCIDAGCSPSIIISISNLRDCQLACLSNANCRTVTFTQSSGRCELFADIPSQYGNMLTEADAVTMIATDDRLLSTPMDINTTICTIPPTHTTATTTTTVSNLFLSETTYSTGITPDGVATVDVNNDNKLDIIVANTDSNNVLVLLNAGDGTFFSQATYSTDDGPFGLAVTDVNHDNKPDIVVANNYANNVGVLLNAGNGTFLNQATYATAPGPAELIVIDVNNDNNPDIVVTNAAWDSVGVLLNTGNGTFLSQTTYSTGSASGPYGLAVVDVNNDTKPDIIVANTVSDNVGVLINAGNGTFLNQTTYSTGSASSSYGVAVADVNNDNKPDIVVANYSFDNVGVLINAGNGTFFNQITYSAGSGSNPNSVKIIDVNNDTKADIVVVNEGLNSVGVLLNAGDGTFLSPSTYSTGNNTGPAEVAIADLNGDHKPDIVATNSNTGNIAVLLHS